MTVSINRRRSLFALAAAAVCPRSTSGAAAERPGSRLESINGWRRRVQSFLDSRRLPIIDLQATYLSWQTNLPLILQFMEEVDVALIAFAAASPVDGSDSLELHRKYPERFIPTTNSGEIPRWAKDPLAFLEVARRDLRTGQYFFMGEHEFRHYPSPEQVEAGQWFRDITIPLDGPVGDGLFKLSAEFGVAFQIHYEIEDSLLPALEAVLARHPRALPIWCHLAMIRYPDRARKYTPEYVRSLIQRFPGLHFDLAVPPPHFIYRPSGARDSTLFDSSGRIVPAWLDLLETYPERFLSASDYRPAVEQYYARYVTNVQRRLILDVLSERTRHLVAYGNAWRLITGEPWR